MWPTGSAVVVGLCYLAGGAARRDTHQDALGVWMAVLGGAAAFLDVPSLYWVLAIAAPAGYLTAAALEPAAPLRQPSAD